jgi:hypothetical protein
LISFVFNGCTSSHISNHHDLRESLGCDGNGRGEFFKTSAHEEAQKLGAGERSLLVGYWRIRSTTLFNDEDFKYASSVQGIEHDSSNNLPFLKKTVRFGSEPVTTEV